MPFDDRNYNNYRSPDPADDKVEHIYALFIALCASIHYNRALWRIPRLVWRSRCDTDGQSLGDSFMLGLFDKPGKQIAYVLPMRLWEKTSFATLLDRSPEWDRHTSQDVIDRLYRLVP